MKFPIWQQINHEKDEVISGHVPGKGFWPTVKGKLNNYYSILRKSIDSLQESLLEIKKYFFFIYGNLEN